MAPDLQLETDALGLVLAAAVFAARKHRDQRRKDQERSPYINHPLDVIHILYVEGGVRDPEVLAAALLHDTVEDTDTTLEELTARFGAQVAGLVAEVTDDRTLPKAQRKQQQIEHAPHISEGAKLVKLADKISNLRDVAQAAPIGWDESRRLEYFQWATRVVDGLRGTHFALEQVFDGLCARFYAARAVDGHSDPS